MSDTATVKHTTPTDVLVKCMEDFGEDEPDDVIVVWTTKSGDIAWSCSTPLVSRKVGMLESAKFYVLKGAE